MDSGYGNGSNKNRSKTDSESTTGRLVPDATENFDSPHSVAPSSSESEYASADLFQLDQEILPNPNGSDPRSFAKSDENEQGQRTDTKNDISISALLSLEKIYGSSRSVSQVSDATRGSRIASLSETKSPPVQLMERPEGYDPNRIPDSVFTSKSSTPMEWSANSNDSLFSIQIGTSLARDQFAVTGAESPGLENIPEESFTKWKALQSGELNKSNEYLSNGVVKMSDQVKVMGQSSLVTKDEERKPRNIDLGKHRIAGKDKVKNTPFRNVNIEDKGDQEGYMNKNVIQHPDQNGINIQPSAFPKKRKSCSWCFCSKRPHWSCKWPHWSCKWPHWSCKWLCLASFCCSWKSTKKLFGCSCLKVLKDRRKKWCSCSCCGCACCSKCSYSCC